MTGIHTEGTPLFALPTNGTPTSNAAALRAEPKSHSDREKLYAAISVMGTHGATEKELERLVGLSGNSVRPRLRELEGWSPKGRAPRPVRIVKSRTTREGCVAYITAEQAQREEAHRAA